MCTNLHNCLLFFLSGCDRSRPSDENGLAVDPSRPPADLKPLRMTEKQLGHFNSSIIFDPEVEICRPLIYTSEVRECDGESGKVERSILLRNKINKACTNVSINAPIYCGKPNVSYTQCSPVTAHRN